MKQNSSDRKKYMGIPCRYALIIGLLLTSIALLDAQVDAIPDDDMGQAKNTFESIWLMNSQTLMVPMKKTLEVDFQHRFGTWNKGYDDLFGIFGSSSNIRLGFDYVPAERLLLGFGFATQDQHMEWDFFGKYALIKQGMNGNSPISLTYFANAAIDTRELAKTNFKERTDRWSFFHQLMIGRQFSEDFSLQLSGNLSWFNFKEQQYDVMGTDLGRDRNLQFSAGALARYKFTEKLGLTVEYDQPITDQLFFDPEPNLSIGLEVTTSSHAFQVFIGNYQGLIPQYNHSFNSNNFGDGNILVGFNITRLWNFK